MSVNEIATPALDKMRSVVPDSRKLGEFTEWLQSKGVHFFGEIFCNECRGSDIGESSGEGYCRNCKSRDLGRRWSNIEAMLADYFEIDLDACEGERRAILESLAAEPEAPR